MFRWCANESRAWNASGGTPFGHDFCHTFRSSMECLGRYTLLVMTSVILSGGVKMRDEHGMLREVYISGHDFCHTFRWYENEGRAWNA